MPSEQCASGTQQTLAGSNSAGAVISEDGQYRYRLSRTWDSGKPTLAFVMLNPSTADATEDDPTIRRCINYARDWGYGSLVVANLFGLRATDPSQLEDHPDPIGPDNDEHLRNVCENAQQVIVAWGAKGSLHGRAEEVASMLDEPVLWALDTTMDGHPNHPLYQPKDAIPTEWDGDEL
ncbi:hypothetical protein C453_12746 [Haloferax elongans ATCC BAA-1513]|uniref:DUF1643 domain-containing protein n=1 Tax=Haloferax elongans ATCC BAA-1513 TaxID=1230453 RepID=M0HMT6_HALEO|nr:DUF1643 domain-containing protein [Haloferax elongans]ELZ84414.1 hypothetical protein C453_12746 [Haloferax elongans ATCC BAA-1513]